MILTKRVTDRGIEDLGGLRLRVLYVHSPHITDKAVRCLSRMKTLKTLFLDGTLLTDNCVESLKRLENLEVLSIHRNSISEAKMQELYQSLPNLKTK